MKSSLLLLGLSCLTSSAFAQQGVIAWELVDRAPGAQPSILASSNPVLGRLFPLSSFFNVTSSGDIGMGTANPQGAFHVLGETFGGFFRVFDTAPSTGKQILAEFSTTTGNGAQLRFSGAGGNFIDIGQDGAGSFVLEGTDVERLKITNAGNFAVGAPAYNNVRVSTDSQYNFTMYGANSNTEDTFSSGVFGDITSTTTAGFGAAIYGRSVDPNREAVFAEGDTGATGTKSFIQPHPTDAAKQIKFVCLEGNESGTYFRGKTILKGGSAVISVPEDFRLVSEADNLTVQLTPMGNARVWLESYDLNRVVIRSTADIEVHYMVNGVRRGYGDLQTIERNTAYVPREAREFGTQYPQAIRDMLVENGTLNPDYTPNLDTAARLGWPLNVQPQLAKPAGR